MSYLDYSTEIGSTLHMLRIALRASNMMDTPHSGICILSLGTRYTGLSRYVKFVDAEHIVTIKLGTSTSTGMSLEGTLGTITSTGSYEHLTLELLEEKLRKIEFTSHLLLSPSKVIYKNYEPVVFDDEDTDEHVGNRYAKIKGIEPSVYNASSLFRTNFKTIRICNFSPPYLTLKIESNAQFMVRRFPEIFTKFFNVPCHVVYASRTRLGPTTRKHCLKRYELYLNDIERAHEKYHRRILDHLKPHYHKLEFTKPIRLLK